MADYLQALNTALGTIKTAARWDTNNGVWMNDVANYSKTAGGIWAPVSPTNPMPINDASSVTALANILARENAVLALAHTAVSVSTSSVVVLASNASRKYALLINNHSMPIYVKVGSAAVLNQGIRLEADGGVYEMKLGENLATGAIYAITESGVGSLLVTEGI